MPQGSTEELRRSTAAETGRGTAARPAFLIETHDHSLDSPHCDGTGTVASRQTMQTAPLVGWHGMFMQPRHASTQGHMPTSQLHGSHAQQFPYGRAGGCRTRCAGTQSSSCCSQAQTKRAFMGALSSSSGQGSCPRSMCAPEAAAAWRQLQHLDQRLLRGRPMQSKEGRA